MWSLDRPLFLTLLLLVPLLIVWVHFRPSRGGRLSFGFSVFRGDSFRPRRGWRTLLSVLAAFAFWLGFVSLILALAGPVIVTKRRDYLTRGIDLIIALDESPSMSARDTGEGNRFEAAKEVIESFIDERENDALGLVSFAAEAALRVPATLDYEAVRAALGGLRIMELGDGTAIGMGIAVSAVHLKESGGQEKVIVLLTDGDNNAGEISPLEAAQVAAQLGIRVYTIGLGREGEATLDFIDPNTGKQYRGVYKGKFNEPLLQEMAHLTGGRYFHAGGKGTLSAVFQEIDALERTDKRVSQVIERKPRHQELILAGLALILAYLLLSRLVLKELL
jgi:Ca-activated chloride channel family protein